MTHPNWLKMSYERQVEYSKAYQKVYAESKNSNVDKNFRIRNTKIRMRLIPPGRFYMGSHPGEKGRKRDEARHPVIISKAFWLAKYELTQKQWYAVTRAKPWDGQSKNNSKYPATYISWQDVQEKLLAKLGNRFDFPTEAEWEYACRSGIQSRFYWGDNESSTERYAWYWRNTIKRGRTHPHRVGEKKPNPWGLYDMIGNVWEWCRDWHGTYNARKMLDPAGPRMGTSRVIRGGDLGQSPNQMRSAARSSEFPSSSGNGIGIRLKAKFSNH